MTFKFLLFVFISAMTLNVFSQQPPLEAGVSHDLAKWRAANYSDVRYKLHIILMKGAPFMQGNIEIDVNLTEEGAKNDLILDWRTTQFANDKYKPRVQVMLLNGKVPLVTEAAEHLRVSHENLRVGENVINIEFASLIKTSGAAITRYIDKEDGGEYLYSLFVPSDASTAFPCFDQPDLKARFQLKAEVSRGWKIVSNTNVYKTTPITLLSYPEDGEVGKTTRTPLDFVEFAETKPISTYVFAFAAGDFAEFEDKDVELENALTERLFDPYKTQEKRNSEPTGLYITSKIYVRKSQAEKFKQHQAEVFRLNREGVKFLEDYFDYKFPFPKYDLVLIPEFPFGGMEHAGATFLREASIIFPTEPTKNDYVSRANVIFHEAAHQWFGDTVTMKWFDDLWLKEGFAEFMAYKTLEKVMPEYNAWKIFYERNKQAAYLTDSTKGTTPIYQEIPNLSAAKSAYGNIVYRKAPSFLRQAEFYLGADKFQTAVRAFLKKHEFANAEWSDLVEEFQNAADWLGNDKNAYSKLSNDNKLIFEIYKKSLIKDWANVWVKKRGMPIIRSVRDEESIYLKNFSGGDHEVNINLALVQNDSLWEQGIWKEKLKFLTINPKGEKETKDVQLIYGRTNIEEINFDEVKTKEPQFIFPNYQDYGYGIFLLDEKSRAYVLGNIQNEKDDFLRAMMWGSLWDSVRETELAPADYVRLVVKNINVETDESTIQTLLGRVSTAMNYYLSDTQREEFAAPIEKLLLEKMQNASTVGQKITYYRTFLNLASSDEARNLLKNFLKPNAQTPFPLKTKDKFDIATRLAILNDADAPKLLADLQKTETSDDAKRYAYAVGAGFPTKDAKEKYFNDFLNNKEISESYIESAFVPFNSVRHSELTLPYLEKALAELPNLKRNRKIFFVNGWLGAFIGGQKSERASAIINKFLADNPNLDRDLRLKILENADNLERAVKIRAKYGK